jgi:hypothetical protein
MWKMLLRRTSNVSCQLAEIPLLASPQGDI